MNQPLEVETFATNGLTGAQETLLVPLWARAVETCAARPILVDPRATEIMQSIDYDFTRFGSGRTVQVGCCVRAAIIDGWVRRFLAEHPSGTVVEIGAGLDTRFERVDNGRVRWFDLDLPEAMELRRQFFQEADRRTFIAQSVFQWDWIETVQQEVRGAIMFLGEGVLYYFEQPRVKELLDKLARNFPGCMLAFDTNTRKSLNYSNRCGPIRKLSGRMVWAIEDVQQINTWGPGYAVVESIAPWDSPEYAVFRRRLPWWLRLAHFAYPPSRRMHRINLMRLGAAPVRARS